MDLLDFNKNPLIKIITLFLINCPEKTSKFFFLVILILMIYNDHQPTNEFLDSLASNSFITCILQETLW